MKRTRVHQVQQKQRAREGGPVEARQALGALRFGDPAQRKRGHHVLAQQPRHSRQPQCGQQAQRVACLSSGC